MIDDLATTMPRLEGALCVDDPELFHPEVGGYQQAKKAIAVCNRCPAESECLDWALNNRTVTGVLGGTTYTERKRLMKWKRFL